MSEVNNEKYIDRKLFIPKEVHKIKLRKGETLVWALDFDQYKNITTDKVQELMKVTFEGLKRQFPNNKIIVTIGEVTLTTITPEEPATTQ
jgi:hypothetical protein